MTSILYAPVAQMDLREIEVYIAAENPHRAATFVTELDAAVLSLAQMPSRGAPRDHIVKGLRMISHGQYNIFYHVDGDMIRIQRVLHSAREVDQVFGI